MKPGTPSIVSGSFEVPNFALGHWTHPEGGTGCSVILAPDLCPAAVEVRGGAPGTRETALLSTGRTVQGADAIVLTGGSAFGLSTADGVMSWLRERGRGFPTAAINVPIVSAAVIFDLTGNHPVWPDAEAGYQAAMSASETWYSGRIGAGAGASVSKVLGREQAVRTGLGIAQMSTGAGTVSAVFANNAFGDLADDESSELLTRPAQGISSTEELLLARGSEGESGQNTVIGAIVLDRPMSHDALSRIVTAGHAGIARVIRPAHCPTDGDTVFAISPERGTCTTRELMILTTAAQCAVARALVTSFAPD